MTKSDPPKYPSLSGAEAPGRHGLQRDKETAAHRRLSDLSEGFALGNAPSPLAEEDAQALRIALAETVSRCAPGVDREVYGQLQERVGAVPHLSSRTCAEVAAEFLTEVRQLYPQSFLAAAGDDVAIADSKRALNALHLQLLNFAQTGEFEGMSDDTMREASERVLKLESQR